MYIIFFKNVEFQNYNEETTLYTVKELLYYNKENKKKRKKNLKPLFFSFITKRDICGSLDPPAPLNKRGRYFTKTQQIRIFVKSSLFIFLLKNIAIKIKFI